MGLPGWPGRFDHRRHRRSSAHPKANSIRRWPRSWACRSGLTASSAVVRRSCNGRRSRWPDARLAIGDAAFSDPLAGQGLRFAMASALAAAAAVEAMVRANRPTLALEYYRDFVNSARTRHPSSLSKLRAGPASPPHSTPIPDILRFIAHPRLAALNVAGTLVSDVAYELPDGGPRPLDRWFRPPPPRPPRALHRRLARALPETASRECRTLKLIC